MKPPSRGHIRGAHRRGPAKKVNSSERSQPSQELNLSKPDTFISLADSPRTPEERRARIEAILKSLGLPNLEEFNRQEREADARARNDATHDASGSAGDDSET